MRIEGTIVVILVSGSNNRIDGTSIRVPLEAIHEPLRETRMPLLVIAVPGLSAGQVRLAVVVTRRVGGERGGVRDVFGVVMV